MSINKLVLIDGHALAYRVFYGLPMEAFTTESGEPTNATFGFTRTLLDLILSDTPPHYLAVSFDVGRTFRDDMYEAYKGTRDKMPDELGLQIERIKEVVRALSIPLFELEGYEADDLIGTIAFQSTKELKNRGTKKIKDPTSSRLRGAGKKTEKHRTSDTDHRTQRRCND